MDDYSVHKSYFFRIEYSLQFGLIAFNVPFHCEKHCNLLQILLGKPSVTYKFYLARNKDIEAFFNDSFIP